MSYMDIIPSLSVCCVPR